MKTLGKANNMYGKLSPELELEIQKFLNNPTVDGWDRINSIIIDARGGLCGTTVWQAVCQIDEKWRHISKPYKPSSTAPAIIDDPKCPPPKFKRPPAAERWSNYPDAFTVARAINLVLKS